jgi:hypothetical protein
LSLIAFLVAGGARAAYAQSADELWQTAQQRYRAGDHAGAAVAARQAAEAGSLIATYEIGYMYENGDGVQQSETQAIRWFTVGAAKGCRECDRALGAHYEAAEEFGTALTYYKRGAALGYPDASYDLARMYEYGLGVPLDLRAAVIWYGHAKAEGDPRAAERERNLIALYCEFDDTFASDKERDMFNGQGPRLAPIGKTFNSMSQRIAWLQKNPGVDVNPGAEARLRSLDNATIAAQEAREAAELQAQWDALTPEQRAEIIAQRQNLLHRYLRLQYWQSNHPGETPTGLV